MGPVEVITSVERRRHWSAAQKQAMVEEAEEPGSTISSVARKYGVHPNQLFRWRKLAHQGALVAVSNIRKAGSVSMIFDWVSLLQEIKNLPIL